jgi:hypothetical protein
VPADWYGDPTFAAACSLHLDLTERAVMADVAVKALSNAINDPTTAVLAIDQLHRLLRSVASDTCMTMPCLMRTVSSELLSQRRTGPISCN